MRLEVKYLKLYDYHNRGALTSGHLTPKIPVLIVLLLDLYEMTRVAHKKELEVEGT